MKLTREAFVLGLGVLAFGFAFFGGPRAVNASIKTGSKATVTKIDDYHSKIEDPDNDIVCYSVKKLGVNAGAGISCLRL